MSDAQLTVIAVISIVVILGLLFRKRLSATWSFLGSKLEVSAENTSANDPIPEKPAGSNFHQGIHSVAAGGDIVGSTINTGDNHAIDNPNLQQKE